MTLKLRVVKVAAQVVTAYLEQIGPVNAGEGGQGSSASGGGGVR
jgi:hypothetical protein